MCDGSYYHQVHILLVCPSADPTSTIDGPLVRTTLTDNDGKQIAFDFSYSMFDMSGRVGKQWAHLVLSVDRDMVTAYADGVIVDHFGFPLDYKGPLNLAYNGEDTTSAITWDTDARGWLGGFDFLDYAITLGAANNQREFAGDIAAVSLHDAPVTGTDANCLFQYGAEQVAMCEDYSAGGWRGPLWLLFNGTMHEQATLNGDAVLDANFGVLLDGSSDYISVQPEGDYSSSLNYAKDGQFGISMWFTRKTCPIPGRYEALYSHSQDDDGSSSWSDVTNSNIHILIGCSGGTSGYSEHSTIAGDILRFVLVDDGQNRMTFDVSAY